MTKTKLLVLSLILFLGVILTHNANAEIDETICPKLESLYLDFLNVYKRDEQRQSVHSQVHNKIKKTDMLGRHLAILGCVDVKN